MRFTLNGRRKNAAPGSTVLEAAREAGIDIPAVCAHDALQPYGACRLCIVEARDAGKKRWRVVTSCLYPVKEGLEVRTDTEKIVRLRRFLMELLLARSPGAPHVRELAARYGVTKSRFSALNDDCILCGLCVRVCAEVVGANAIGFSQRGIGRKVESPFGVDHSRCLACGACTYVCPTGAVQMEHVRTAELRAGGGEHLCRYTLMGFLSDAVCSLNYECSRCEIDQKFRDEAETHPMLAEARKRSRKKARG
ncbi:MAG TPA: 2Fe-2S iron-sulfur cluster-binding protein [Candidatus Bathyarchaeia archaeon]|nr:2Fe-2S iron-sulfur cluster-binding protein [Candidatus Bathyarchaeia archaeon]